MMISLWEVPPTTDGAFTRHEDFWASRKRGLLAVTSTSCHTVIHPDTLGQFSCHIRELPSVQPVDQL